MIAFLPGILWIAFHAQAAPRDPYEECKNPAPDDGRPYMLCVTETDFELADAGLNRQWRERLEVVSREGGSKAEKELLKDQRRWLRNRDRECDFVAVSSPVQHSSTNQMACLAQMTKRRTAALAQMVH